MHLAIDQVAPSRQAALRTQLISLRKKAEITQKQAAEHVPCSLSTIIRMETGRAFSNRRVIEKLLLFYGATPKQISALLSDTATDGRSCWLVDQRPTLAGIAPLISKDFYQYLGSETTATQLRQYRCDRIPSLLQTPGYAAAYISATLGLLGPTATAALDRRGDDYVITKLAAVTKYRQEIIAPQGTPARFLLDEAAVVRRIGTEQDMRAAWQRLLEVSGYPSVSVRVVPFEAGAHIGLSGSYTILDPADGAGQIVTVTHPTRTVHTITKLWPVQRYIDGFDDLADRSLSEQDSAAFLRELLQ